MSPDKIKQQAISLFNSQDLKGAKNLFARLCKRNRNDFESWCYLGIVLASLDELSESEKCLRHSVVLQPGNAQAHFNLANLLEKRGALLEARQEHLRAIGLQPGFFGAMVNLASIMRREGEFSPAIQLLERASSIQPNHPLIYQAIASTLMSQGKPIEAASFCQKALASGSRGAGMESMLLFISTLYIEDPGELLSLHQAWFVRHKTTPVKGWWESGRQEPEKKLRIAYISPHFYRHSVAYFIKPILEQHNKEQFKVYCYADVAREDSVTRQLRREVDVWRDIHGEQDQTVLDQIEADRIDILVDLAGHMTGNRMGVLMRKPAPIQAEYIGYLNTTGVSVIDYRIGDQWTDPPGIAEEVSSERIARLPHGYLCYQPYEETPMLPPAPCVENGYITFGSFNNLSKTSSEVVQIWAELLKSLPDARLVLKNESFLDAPTQEAWFQRFSELGIDPSRIDLLKPNKSTRDHLENYGLIDIALDTWPYNGTTTTCEALWMGVPVITLPGPIHAGRQGLSLLSQVGIDELVANSKPEYICIAAELARSPERISDYRNTLREQMRSSPLCDGPLVSRELETVYRNMWVNWCQAVNAGDARG